MKQIFLRKSFTVAAPPTSLMMSLCLGLSLGIGAMAACPSPTVGDPLVALGDGFVSIQSIDETTLEVKFNRAAKGDTLVAANFHINDFTVIPPVNAQIASVTASDNNQTVRLTTSPLLAGKTYTLSLQNVLDNDGHAFGSSINFVAQGQSPRVTVEVRMSNVEIARQYENLRLLATVDADSGSFSEEMQSYPIQSEGDAYVARLEVQIDPNRTLSRGDDSDPSVDRRAYAVRAVDEQGRAASPLVLFALTSTDDSRNIGLDLQAPPDIVITPTEPTDVLPPAPIDANPADGVKVVRLVVDDRASKELVSPKLKVSFSAAGQFDATFPQTLNLTPMTGENAGYWEATVNVAVDANRTLDGQTPETFAYVAYLVENGTEYEALNVSMIAPDETPETVRLRLGNPAWTPVTFRVDVSRAYLTPDGSKRGVYPGESAYLTGEWQEATDALGANCGDAFTGGEKTCLRMRELVGKPGVYTRTLWLPPGRAYGWKVVRCEAEYGCGPLNQLVASSGRAFATVMKNLVTDNVDAFADPAVGVVDPLAPASTTAGGRTFDYSSATVYVGGATGAEPDPADTPDGRHMFKQEAPDLPVVVQNIPIVTPVYHVGTWRDVNLGKTPTQIIEESSTVDLNSFDYDDGFIGRFPPSRAEP